MQRFHAVSDDFYVNLSLNTEMPLPNNRDTVLHFFEQVGKSYPQLIDFYTRESGELVLESDKEHGFYRWVSLEAKRLCSGFVNPSSTDEAHHQHEMILDLASHLLPLSRLDCETLDVLYGFDFTFAGNHDEVVSEALGLGTGLEGLFDQSKARIVNFEPSITFALDESCRLQCRLSVETRTHPYQVRTANYSEDPISVYFTVRQYWGNQVDQTFLSAYRRQREIGEEFLLEQVIPQVIRPLAQLIASR